MVIYLFYVFLVIIIDCNSLIKKTNFRHIRGKATE